MRQGSTRRRYMVHPRYQLGQAGIFLGINLLLLLLAALLLSWFYLFYFQGHVVCNHNRAFPWYLTAVGLLVLLLSSLWSLRRSRSVAGMMRKLEIVLSNAARGVFPEQPLVFRRGDSFGELARPLNDCVVQLKRQRQCLTEIAGAVQALEGKRQQGMVSEVELHKVVARMQGILGKWAANGEAH